MLNKTPPRVQITPRDVGLQDSKSDSHVSSTARRPRSATGGISSIALTERRRVITEDLNELKITAALNRSAERNTTPVITPTSTPTSEAENESSSEEEISADNNTSPSPSNHFRLILNELLESYGGYDSPEAKLLLTTLSISKELDFKEKEQAYTFLQIKINELRGDALLISVSIHSALINHLLKSLANKKSVKKDYDSIVLVIRDDVPTEAIEHSLTDLMDTTFSSDGFKVLYHSSQKELVTNLEKKFNLKFDKKKKYGFFELKDCVLSKINSITKDASKVLVLSDKKYEEQLQSEMRKSVKKDYDPTKFEILSTTLNKDLPSDRLLASQVSEKILNPILKLILERQNSGNDRVLSRVN